MKIILIGNGKLTYFLGREFVAEKHQVTIINSNAVEAAEFSHQIKATVIVGDGTHPYVLREAEAPSADLVVALTAEDEDNLVACQIAQQHYGVSRTIALVNDPNHQEFFEQMGISVVFSATQILANLIEKRADFADIASFFEVDNGQVGVTEIILDEDSPALDKTLQNLDLPEGALIGCIIRQDRGFVPRGWTHLQLRDRLILISQSEHYKQLLEALTGKAE
jgi:trk system potassium uptake protein TrkA